MKILIGYDGSEGARDALIDLQRAGLPKQAEALIVSVADVMMMPDSSSGEFTERALASGTLTPGLTYIEKQSAAALREARELANEAKALVRLYFPLWDVRAEALAGTPAFELIGRANEWQPDLIVVGSQGLSALGRFVLGSVSKRIATDSRQSVRVTRAEHKEKATPPKILIGVDGSNESELAVREVSRRIWPEGTEVRIIFVDDSASSQTAQIVPAKSDLMTGCNEETALAARRMVERAHHELSAIGLEVSTAVEKGDPKIVLLEQAQTWDADSIFVGARRFTGAFDRFWLGSVSTAVVTKAHCSIEIVRLQSNK